MLRKNEINYTFFNVSSKVYNLGNMYTNYECDF